MGSGDPRDTQVYTMKTLALVDCNSFYASCEQVFRPDLRDKPVVVLSNNDGCLVAMNGKAKALNLPRGVPLFKVQNILDKAGAVVFSSNYTLYGDLSRRVMDTLRTFTPRMEVYSIDEAFMEMEGSREEILQQAVCIKKTVEQWVGIPVSVGIGPTKALTKIAGHQAKSSAEGVCMPRDSEWPKLLRQTDVRDIWGIGRQYARMLHDNGYHTAEDLIGAEEVWVKKKMTLTGLKLLWELKGKPSFTMEEAPPPKQGILYSRSFGHPVTSKEEIMEAGADYASWAGVKLRSQHSVCHIIQTSITTNPFRKGDQQYSRTRTREMAYPVSYLPDIVSVVKEHLELLYRPGFRYKKISVFLAEIEDAGKVQLELFHQNDIRREAVMKAVEKINRKHGSDTMHCKLKRSGNSWQMRREKLSPRYTTCMADLPVVYAR